MLMPRLVCAAFISVAAALVLRDGVLSVAAHHLVFASLGDLITAPFPWETGLLRRYADAATQPELAGWLVRVAMQAPACVASGALGIGLPLLARRLGSARSKASPAPVLARAVATRDPEFLPAAVEILHTPPSPIGTTLLLYICGAFAVALAWSYFGWLDIYATAPGKLQPSGRSKVVQPVYPGKVAAIYVKNGGHVNAGDLLIELDPTETTSDRDSQARAVEVAGAEAARRKIAIAQTRAGLFEPAPIDFAPGTDAPVRRREEGVLAADLEQLGSSMASLKAEHAEKLATRARLTASIEARQKIIALARERVAMREKLSGMGAGSRALVIDAEEQLETQIVTDTGERGQLLETSAAAETLARKIDGTIAQFIATQSEKLGESERERDKAAQELLKAQAKRDMTRLTAPISGTVQQLAVTTVGQVVASGQSLLTVVPTEGPIEIEALIANSDIGFVEPGQPAVVKVDAFPFTRYGTIDGSVSMVSRDAVDQRFAADLSDAANAAKPQGAQGAPSAQQAQTQNLVFPATITLARHFIAVENNKELSLTPGMSVTVEIKTGQRRALDYLLSPVRQVIAQTAHER
jgi:hemolysin D